MKLYTLETDQNITHILDPDGDIILSGTRADMGLLVIMLNNRSSDKYKVSYSFDKHERIISSTIYQDQDFIVTLPEYSSYKEEETSGYGILTHLNRRHT